MSSNCFSMHQEKTVLNVPWRQNGGTEREIIKKIEKRDESRSDYYKYHTGRDWNDARNYDFCLNTSSTSYDKLVKVVKDYIEICKH